MHDEFQDKSPAQVEERENDILSCKQINYARQIIEDHRKLEIIPLVKVWPYLNYCCCCLMRGRHNTFKVGLKNALRKKMDIPVTKSEKRIQEDPYLQLGYGMNAFFQITIQLMLMMFCIMVVVTPIMFVYSRYDHLSTYPGYMFNQFTLGNMGGASVRCGSASMEASISITCRSGLIQTSAISNNSGKPVFDIGIIPKSNDVNTYCTNSSFEDDSKCSSFINQSKVSEKLQKDCDGQ